MAEKNVAPPVLEKVGASPPSSDIDDSFERFSGVNEKKLIRKLDRTLLPALTILYLLSFLDRSNGESIEYTH